jgi:methylated-DNA-protein-cysteine methyltransferase-like protein
MTDETARIITLIKAIPRGKVSSYRDIARAAGFPNGARQVVRVLHSLSRKENLPWHRVIRADGKIGLPAGSGLEEQMILLRNEGVEVSDLGKINMEKFAVTRFSDAEVPEASKRSNNFRW